MTTTYMETKLTLSAALSTSVGAGTGLGRLVIVCPAGASVLPSQYTTVATAAAATALLTATNITANGNLQLQAAYAQDFNPGTVVVATYDDATETPDDALTRLDAAEIEYGIVVPATVDNADLAACAAYVVASNKKWLRMIAETRDADMITATPDAALDSLSDEMVRLVYGASSQGLAGALGGWLAGKGLLTGPAAAEHRVASVSLPGVTAAEFAFAKANNVGILLALDAGSGASQRFMRGTKAYSGDDWKSSLSLGYACKLIRTALLNMFARKATRGEPLQTTTIGVAEAVACVSEPLQTMAAAGHFRPGTYGSEPNTVELPSGYKVTGAVSGDDVVLTVLLGFGQEVDTITVNVTGEVV